LRRPNLSSEAFDAGWDAAIDAAEALALKWRDENRASRDSARVRGARRNAWDGDQTHLIMAEQLDGAAIECHAIAGAIRDLASGMSASGQDAEERLEAKPASPVAESETPKHGSEGP
jgi:hypothetical protein